MDINIAFSRQLLKIVSADVKAMRAKPVRDAWVYNLGRDHWEFHGPAEFYWHGRASNAYEARARGWQAWLRNPKGTH